MFSALGPDLRAAAHPRQLGLDQVRSQVEEAERGKVARGGVGEQLGTATSW